MDLGLFSSCLGLGDLLPVYRPGGDRDADMLRQAGQSDRLRCETSRPQDSMHPKLAKLGQKRWTSGPAPKLGHVCQTIYGNSPLAEVSLACTRQNMHAEHCNEPCCQLNNIRIVSCAEMMRIRCW